MKTTTIRIGSILLLGAASSGGQFPGGRSAESSKGSARIAGRRRRCQRAGRGSRTGRGAGATAPADAAPPTGKQEAPPAQPTEKQRGVLGVRLDDHAVVETVAPGLGAAKAGLQPGDAIVAIDGQPIKQTAELTAIVATKSAGDKVRVTYVRDGREQTAEVTLFGPSEQQQAANRSHSAKRFASRSARPCKRRTTRGPAS